MADAVMYLGPLWAHSAFSFESANGWLSELHHGSNNPTKQVQLTISMACMYRSHIYRQSDDFLDYQGIYRATEAEG